MRTPAERIAHGKSVRDHISRAAHSELKPAERNFNPLHILSASAVDRVPRLLPVKYFRMSAGPFAFFRGAVSIMAADLARLPHSGLHVQLCGDAHVQNLGSFATPDGRLVFDYNDFDETIEGPWEWDVKRMAASIVLAGRAAGQRSAPCGSAAEAFVQSYCRTMNQFSREPILQVARHQIHRQKSVAPIHAALLQSQRATTAGLVKKFTAVNSRAQRRFRKVEDIFWPVRGLRARQVLAALELYRKTLAPERLRLFEFFRPVDVGFKIVGTGSVGLRDYVVLLEGSAPGDFLFLQIKQEVASAYAQYLPKWVCEHEGRRVVEGQRSIQPNSDPLLGWTSIEGHQFLVRQLNDHKGSIDLEQLQGEGLKQLALVAGELMARGHARSGDVLEIAGYCGSGDRIARAIREFGEAYAGQTEADHKLFMAAIKAGKIKIAKPAAAS
jgi:uncharacterized protein (DUF2252 family)